jgi:hypothetical protein
MLLSFYFFTKFLTSCSCLNQLIFVGQLGQPWTIEGFTLTYLNVSISQNTTVDNVTTTAGTVTGNAFISQIGLNGTVTVDFNTSSGLQYLWISFSENISSFGELTATLQYNKSSCERLVGTGGIVTDPNQVPFNLTFTVNATLNACIEQLEIYGQADSSFVLDGVNLGAGALVHIVRNQSTTNYTALEIDAQAVISGAHVEVFYDAFTKLWYINLNYTSTYFNANASLVHQVANCSADPVIPQFEGLGTAVARIGDSNAEFNVSADYFNCNKHFVIKGFGNSWSAHGLQIISPYFDVEVYNSSEVSLTNYSSPTYVNGKYTHFYHYY